MTSHAEAADSTMLIVLFILSILCGVLMILTVTICCYICARRYYIKRSGDVHDARFVAGHLWWTDNNRRAAADRKVPLITSRTPVNRKIIGADPPITKSSVTMVGCGPGGCSR